MKPYSYIHFTSLDIVLGALGMSCFAARLFAARPGPVWWVSLALTVWVLYVGDHLLDAWRYRKSSHSAMHGFVFRNRRILVWLLGVVAVTDILLIVNFLDRHVVRQALIMALLVLAFYAVRHLLRKNRVFFIPGELFVLLIYLGGTWLAPFILRQEELSASHGLISAMAAGVVLMNLGIISLYDIRMDKRLGIASMAQYLGRKTTRNMVLVTGAATGFLGIMHFLVWGAGRYGQLVLILAGMAALLILILFYPPVFSKENRFRMASDAVFYLGFLALLVGP